MVSGNIYCKKGFGAYTMKNWEVVVAKAVGVLFFIIIYGVTKYVLYYRPNEPRYDFLFKGNALFGFLYILLAYLVAEHTLRLLNKRKDDKKTEDDE